MTFDDQLKTLIFFHLEEHTSAQHLLQVLENDDFARDNIAPEDGIKKSSFAEAINTRGLEQLSHIYKNLQTQAIESLPKEHNELGDLVSIDGTKYWVATDRFDLTAEQVAFIYKLRWDVEKFFAWWKRHLKVYHLIARSEYGLMVQILAGLITYLLLAIYCREQHNEKVSIKRVRELRINIQNEIRMANSNVGKPCYEKNVNSSYYASS